MVPGTTLSSFMIERRDTRRDRRLGSARVSECREGTPRRVSTRWRREVIGADTSAEQVNLV